jgi:prepilin-type N-terminal cleavage/methylation domain-containing protein
VRVQRQGFTLAEVLIAVLIVGVGVLGLIGVRIYAIKGAQSSPDHQTASLIAASLIADAEDRLGQGDPLDEVEEFLNDMPLADPKFSQEVKILLDVDTPAPNEGLVNLIHIDVAVSWERKGQNAVYRLHTRLANI